MSNEYALPFIEKAIANTKNQKMIWSSMRTHSDLLKLEPNLVSDTLSDATIETFVSSDLINYSESFYSKFQSGYIFLLIVSKDVYSDINYYQEGPPPTLHCLSLRIQKNLNSYSKEIANSDEPSDISIQLKRLYNLAENSAYGHDSIINDFLND